jgi:hypothetical protein
MDKHPTIESDFGSLVRIILDEYTAIVPVRQRPIKKAAALYRYTGRSSVFIFHQVVVQVPYPLP